MVSRGQPGCSLHLVAVVVAAAVDSPVAASGIAEDKRASAAEGSLVVDNIVAALDRGMAALEASVAEGRPLVVAALPARKLAGLEVAVRQRGFVYPLRKHPDW